LIIAADSRPRKKVVDPLADTPKTYASESGAAELVSALVAEGKPLEILVDGESYTLELASMGREEPTPEMVQRSIAAIEATAGEWKDFDAEAFLEYVYQRRSAVSTRPPVNL
jgi:hypothetical protein